MTPPQTPKPRRTIRHDIRAESFDDPLTRIEYARVGSELVEWAHVLAAQFDAFLAGGMHRSEAWELVSETNAMFWESRAGL
jgi:hypothetical protein